MKRIIASVVVLIVLSSGSAALAQVDDEGDSLPQESARSLADGSKANRDGDGDVSSTRKDAQINDVNLWDGRAVSVDRVSGEVVGRVILSYTGTGNGYVDIMACENRRLQDDICFNLGRWDPPRPHGLIRVSSRPDNYCERNPNDDDVFYSRGEVRTGEASRDVESPPRRDRELPAQCYLRRVS